MEEFFGWMQGILELTPERWKGLTEHLPAELLYRKPNDREWSALECLYHLLDVERVFQTRLSAFLAGRDFPGFDPDAEGTRPDETRTPAAVFAEFAGLRRRSLEMLSGLAIRDLDRPSRHAELGPVVLRELLNEWAAHDLNHTIQAERALMQPFILACGPWQVYFQEHLVKGEH